MKKEFPAVLNYSAYIGRPYAYMASPARLNPDHFRNNASQANRLDTDDFNLSQGLNCQRFVHEIYSQMGISLPQMWSREIEEDESLLFYTINYDPVQQNAQLFIGDIFMIEPAYNPRKHIFPEHHPGNDHMGIYSGRKYPNGEPEILHANFIDGTVSRWPLSRFFLKFYTNGDPSPRKRYVGLKAVKRLLPNYWDIYIRPYVGYFFYTNDDKENGFLPQPEGVDERTGTGVIWAPRLDENQSI